MRIPDIQSRVGVDVIMVGIRGSGLRNRVGENLVLTHRLKPLTIGHSTTFNFKIIVVLGYEVPNTNLIKLS